MQRSKGYIIIILILLGNLSKGQFYNGSQVDFGKNRVQFNDYLWSHYKYEQFNIYFYEEGKNIADYLARSAHLQLSSLETQFEYKLKRKIQFVIYNTQNQSRESNIGNYPNENSNTGGFARISGNKVFVYFDGNHKNFDKQIRSGVAKVLVNEIIYGDELSDEIKNGAIINFPSWFKDGLISYLSEKWSTETENKVKSYMKLNKFKKFSWLAGEEAIYAGHSIWYYIADVYGEQAVSDVLYMSKVSRNTSDGLLFILGKSTDNLVTDWENYFKSRFISDNKGKEIIQNDKSVPVQIKKLKRYDRLCLNSKESHLAFTTNKLSQQKVIVTEIGNKKNQKVILTLGQKLDVVPDHSFPVICWHPVGDVLSIFYEYRGDLYWMTYNIVTKEKIKTKLFQFEKILDANYSSNGLKIALSAVVKGKTDIYVLDVSSRSQEQITNDYFDDRYPIFINNSKDIVFSSNRVDNSMEVGGDRNVVYAHTSDLFMYSYSNKKNFYYSPQILRRITKTPLANEKMPLELSENKISYLSDANGIYNEWEAILDSGVAFVDTVIHYRYFSRLKATSNVNSNILWHSSNGKKIARIFKDGDRNQLNINPFWELQYNLVPTQFKKTLGAEKVEVQKGDESLKVFTIDSIRNIINKNPDFVYTDFYLFQDEIKGRLKDSVIQVDKPNRSSSFQLLSKFGFLTSDSIARKAKMRNYELSFKTAEVSLDLDNRFLNPQYQRYSGGTTYPMPGMNGFMKYSVIDLLEDHLITGGIRMADLLSNELFLSYSDRKKRLDKQYLLYRGTNTDVSESTNYLKNITYEGIYRLTYPLSIVDRFSTTFSLRYDQFIPLSASKELMLTPIKQEFWPSIRVDYTFDNTRYLGKNIFTGLRFKLFSEVYQEAPKWNNQMLTYGADLRYYLKLHRSLILANRFSGGSSLGSQRLMYYMGGVDSWATPQFNQELDPGELPDQSDYAFQTLATNMRGFTQNIRNGTSFMLLSSEIRWPIVSYLFSRPFSSDFINHFQLNFFGDLGTAWSGSNPFSEQNSLNKKELIIGGEARTGEITLRTNKEPIVGGYGIGLRSSLMGYFIRVDWAWGVEDGVNQGRQLYLSLVTDF
jgi:hypothetical protein